MSELEIYRLENRCKSLEERIAELEARLNDARDQRDMYASGQGKAEQQRDALAKAASDVLEDWLYRGISEIGQDEAEVLAALLNEQEQK